MGHTLSTGQKIVTWAAGHKGKAIGKGECWDLADQAMRAAGALSSADLGPMGDDADYVWGDPVADLKDVQPGDVLQIRDDVITVRIVTDATWGDGAQWTEERVREEKRPHHTAIVAANQGNGVLSIYEQNAEPKGRVVQLNTLLTSAPVAVTRKFKKKLPRPVQPRKGLYEIADVVETTTTEVTGTIWAYRPKLREKAK